MHRSKGHKLLTDSEADEKDRVIAGVRYPVRYLGSADISSSDGKGKGCTDQAVSEIYSRYSNKANFKSLTRRELFVSANCVSLSEPSKGAVVFRYQTVKITFCNTSEEHHNAFVIVVKESPSSSFRAHVVHCESPAQACEVCTAMSQAFAVRSALFNAKRIDKAGWTTGLLLSKQKIDERKARPEEAKGEPRATEITENGHFDADADANNNTFGDFACAVASSQWNGNRREESSEGMNGVFYANGWSNGNGQANPGRDDCAENKENRSQNRVEFSLARVLLSRSPTHRRSNSAPFNFSVQNPWAENAQNGQKELSRGLLQAAANGTTDDDDGFSTLARERSASMSLVRPVS